MVSSYPGLALFMTPYVLIVKHTTTEHSVDADGFGVCFEMGIKCYKIRALCIPSL